MTVDELIDRLSEMPGYREVDIEVDGTRAALAQVEDRGISGRVVLS